MTVKNEKNKIRSVLYKEMCLIKKHIIEFIKNSKSSIVCDPFAGKGDLLKHVSNIAPIKKLIGFDIDKSLKWKFNDSLLNIPKIKNAIYITNPPWIAKQSARRKGENNGQDFIFKDKTKNWLIGVEIILLHPNILIYDLNKIKNPSEYTKKFEKTNSKPIFDELNRLVTSHTNSLKKYEKCNKYYLIIQTNNFLPEFMYQLLECYANDFLNKENKWEHIYIF